MGKMEGSFSDKNMTSDGEGFAGSLQNNKEAIQLTAYVCSVLAILTLFLLIVCRLFFA